MFSKINTEVMIVKKKQLTIVVILLGAAFITALFFYYFKSKNNSNVIDSTAASDRPESPAFKSQNTLNALITTDKVPAKFTQMVGPKAFVITRTGDFRPHGNAPGWAVGYVEPLLPPRQSRGDSHDLVWSATRARVRSADRRGNRPGARSCPRPGAARPARAPAAARWRNGWGN